jgi:hypothetical protein
MKKAALTLALILAASWAWGQDFDAAAAPQVKIATPLYWSAVGIAAGFTAADLTTTLQLPCTVERANPWMYGVHHPAERAAPIMIAQVAGAAAVSYFAKRSHGPMHRLWALPLMIAASSHAVGTAHNLKEYCR